LCTNMEERNRRGKPDPRRDTDHQPSSTTRGARAPAGPVGRPLRRCDEGEHGSLSSRSPCTLFPAASSSALDVQHVCSRRSHCTRPPARRRRIEPRTPWRDAIVCARPRLVIAWPDEEPSVHLALSLHRHRPTRRYDIIVCQERSRGVGDLDPVRNPMRFHTTRGVHGVTP